MFGMSVLCVTPMQYIARNVKCERRMLGEIKEFNADYFFILDKGKQVTV